jgi:glyoxylase-like metal-dependent hydrolase (beta-lactamase superfamily II)
MNLQVINTGGFKLDGGAMFGVVPKSMWSKVNPPDENNMCSWVMRCLLVETDNRLILIDNGMGNKQSEKFFSYYYLWGEDSLSGSLEKAGVSVNDITDNFLTHLHFDHCGGSIINDQNKKFTTQFSNAVYWSDKRHWDWATHPNDREKASFLKENILPIRESGQLKFVENKSDLPFDDIIYTDGHTEKMMLPKLSYKGKTLVFMADLLPSAAHIPLPWVMSYDVRPLETLKEKEKFLNEAVDNDYILFFEHDPQFVCCTLKRTERGIRADQTFKLADI